SSLAAAMRPLPVAVFLALLLCSLVDAAYFIDPSTSQRAENKGENERGRRAMNPFLDSMGKRALNPFMDTMGKRAMNPFLDSMGKRSVETFEELPTEKRYFDSLAGQSLGKRSVLALVPFEWGYNH
ncbi:hypothetical protein PENTCL1PPCAC_28794, partial [Pristionchus entomophagus]